MRKSRYISALFCLQNFSLICVSEYSPSCDGNDLQCKRYLFEGKSIVDPYLKQILNSNEEPEYLSSTALQRRKASLDILCDQFSDPINPEYWGLYGNYFQTDNITVESERRFFRSHDLTICLPDIREREEVAKLFKTLTNANDQLDSLDPCQIFFKTQTEPSNRPVELPDYPGVYYIPNHPKIVHCDMKNGLREIKHRLIIVKHPMENVVDKFSSISKSKNNFSIDQTFSDFVNAVISGEKTPNGIHFEPFWQTCRICPTVLRPNLISKVEHLEEDLRNIWETLNLKESDWPLPSHKTLSSKAKKLYEQLNYSQIRSLFDLLRLDHELFRYNPIHYFKLARDFGNQVD